MSGPETEPTDLYQAAALADLEKARHLAGAVLVRLGEASAALDAGGSPQLARDCRRSSEIAHLAQVRLAAVIRALAEGER